MAGKKFIAYKCKSRRAISPVITTVLLVLIAIVLAVIILLWARGFIKEKVMKFDEPAERACEKVDFDASLGDSRDSLFVNNIGNVHIYKIAARVTKDGDSTILQSSTENFGVGSSKSASFSSTLDGEIEVIPIILGKKEKSGEMQEYQCPEEYWKAIG